MAKRLSDMPQIKKIRPLCFLQLLKLKKVKCAYFFNLRPSWPFFGHFLIFLVRVRLTKMSKNSKNKVNMVSFQKNKTTFFSSTFKVQKVKVCLLFNFEAILTMIWPFFDILVSLTQSKKIRKWPKNGQDGLKLKK